MPINPLLVKQGVDSALSMLNSGIGQSGASAPSAPKSVGGGIGKIAGAVGSMIPGANLVTGGIAAAKFISGKIKEKKADAMLPKYEDPEERALSSYAARRKRAFQTGTASAAQRNQLAQAMKTGINKSFQVGGGSKGLNMLTSLFNQAQLGIQDKDLAGELQYAGMESDIKKRISQRKLELGLLKYNTAQARAAQQIKEGKSIGMATLAKSIGINPSDINPYANAAGSYYDEQIQAKNEE